MSGLGASDGRDLRQNLDVFDGREMLVSRFSTTVSRCMTSFYLTLLRLGWLFPIFLIGDLNALGAQGMVFCLSRSGHLVASRACKGLAPAFLDLTDVGKAMGMRAPLTYQL